MVDAIISPKGQLELLSAAEIEQLQSSSHSIYSTLFRNCALAVLSTGVDSDDGDQLLAAHEDFAIELISSPRGVKLKLSNAPANAFVGGSIIEGIRAHLFAVLRDIVYLQDQYAHWQQRGESITDMVFKTLRNARALKPRKRPNLVVCWGGHSISGDEYDFSKEVGYRLGLRGLDICTGCGIGAMKGPMKGATVAHAKQRTSNPRYIGVSEPGIIASEAPNAIVNELIIMPDIEKRLEVFVRLGHGIVVFPGGVGTAEEILYVLGILLNNKNKNIVLPLIFAGSEESIDYFQKLDRFIGLTLGEQAQALYQIVTGDPITVGSTMRRAMRDVYSNRRELHDAFYYNWTLHIDSQFQNSFDPTHENMAALNLRKDQPIADLAANLRRAFSGIVAGNIKPDGITAIKKHGCFTLNGDAEIIHALDELLRSFARDGRMKLAGQYVPCYELREAS